MSKIFKNFFYGREDVVRGMRGYRIFNSSTILPEKTCLKIEDCFSDRDPTFYTNQQVEDFIVYFKLPDSDEWIFGKGIIEDRGHYSSYIIHCVLLDEIDRKNLIYNPFYLIKQLNPKIGDNRTKKLEVSIPKQINLQSEIEIISEIIDKIQVNWNQYQNIGEILSYLFDEKKILLPIFNEGLVSYKKIENVLWPLLFFLLPLNLRKHQSISTFNKILLESLLYNINILGVIDSKFQENNRKKILFDQSNKNIIGQWLYDKLKGKNKSEKKDLLNFYYNFIINTSHQISIESIIHATDRPSVDSLQHWPKKKQIIIDWKLKHYKNVLERNKFDMFSSDILKKQFFSAIRELLNERDEKNYESINEIIKTLRDYFPDEIKEIEDYGLDPTKDELIELIIKKIDYEKNIKILIKKNGTVQLFNDPRFFKPNLSNIHNYVIKKLNKLEKSFWYVNKFIKYFEKFPDNIEINQIFIEKFLDQIFKNISIDYKKYCSLYIDFYKKKIHLNDNNKRLYEAAFYKIISYKSVHFFLDHLKKQNIRIADCLNFHKTILKLDNDISKIMLSFLEGA